MNLESKRPPSPLFRVGRGDDAWAVPDWAYAKEDGTFGNRFDDPMRVYRVLYASSQRLGCFIETLARFRVDVSFVADLALMENGEDDFTAFGAVRGAWIKGRCIGTANVEGDYADIYALGWVSHLRSALAGIAVKLGMKEIDLSSLERAEPRLLTQQAGRIASILRAFQGRTGLTPSGVNPGTFTQPIGIVSFIRPSYASSRGESINPRDSSCRFSMW